VGTLIGDVGIGALIVGGSEVGGSEVGGSEVGIAVGAGTGAPVGVIG
jgi:hypothetical protein